VHPLDDIPEGKEDAKRLGPMRMAGSARVFLYELRGYLLPMFGLPAFRVLQRAGMIRSCVHRW
jgi:hypothetical protein